MEVTPVSFDDLAFNLPTESSTEIRNRVIEARLVQLKRYQYSQTHCNAQMQRKELTEFCEISQEGKQLLKQAMDRLGLSARAYDRILKVARTIADLEESENILSHHISEAIQYRSLDREFWNV